MRKRTTNIKRVLLDDELDRRFKACCDGITAQNYELIDKLTNKQDFDPGPELDCTRNSAAYRLTDFFNYLTLYPQGLVPLEYTNAVTSTTDKLIETIIKTYPLENIILKASNAGRAFRSSQRIWRVTKPVCTYPPKQYSHMLKDALDHILSALNDLNAELDKIPLLSTKQEEKTIKVEVVNDIPTRTNLNRAKREIIKSFSDIFNEKHHDQPTTLVRQQQVNAVRDLLHKAYYNKTEISLHEACMKVWTNLKGGYPSPKSLYQYCNEHKTNFD